MKGSSVTPPQSQKMFTSVSGWLGALWSGLNAEVPDLILSGLAFVGLILATALYYGMVRRRGALRQRQRAEEWDRALSHARAIRRLQDLERPDRHRLG